MDKRFGPIAYLTGEYPRATDTYIQREVAQLRVLGHDVITCSVRRTDAAHLVGSEQREEAARTFYVVAAAMHPLTVLRCHAQAVSRAPRRYFKALRLALRSGRPGLKGLLYQLFYFVEAAVLADHLRRNHVQHLHNHIAKSSCTLAMITSEMSGIPFSFTLHGPDIFFAPEDWRLDLKIAKAQFVACISHFCRSQAMAFSTDDQWRKLHIVHCGVTLARYAQTENTGDGTRLLFVGRLAAVKGLPILLEAIKDLPDAKLTVVGDGPDRAALKATAPDHVTFVGYKSQGEVAELLAQSDALVLPSFAEGVPVVLMEAMAASRPVVTTRIAGVPELVEDGESGILVAPGDVADLRDALQKIMSDPDLRQSMGRAGCAKVTAEFNIATEAAWLSDILTSYGANTPVNTLRPQSEDDA